MRKLQLLVEGEGDIKAVRLLVRRILEKYEIFDVDLPLPHKRGEYPTVARHFDNYFLAAIKEQAPILWVMDFDSEGYTCPVAESNQLIAKAQALRPGWPIKIAFLVKEYESLFLHDEAATRAVFTDIPKNTHFPDNPEGIRGAKEWLSKQRPKGFAYKETTHQEKITAHLNLQELGNKSKDFAHLERAILSLINLPVPPN